LTASFFRRSVFIRENSGSLFPIKGGEICFFLLSQRRLFPSSVMFPPPPSLFPFPQSSFSPTFRIWGSVIFAPFICSWLPPPPPQAVKPSRRHLFSLPLSLQRMSGFFDLNETLPPKVLPFKYLPLPQRRPHLFFPAIRAFPLRLAPRKAFPLPFFWNYVGMLPFS